MAANSQFGSHNPTYTRIREETLPPIHELVEEHKRMVAEMIAAGEREKRRFEAMMTAWALRARAGVTTWSAE